MIVQNVFHREIFPSDHRSSMKSVHQFSSRPDCNKYSRGTFFYSAHCSLSHPICFRSVWCRFAIFSRKDLHRLCQIPRNCQCKWLLIFSSTPGTSLDFSRSPEKFLFFTRGWLLSRCMSCVKRHTFVATQYITRTWNHYRLTWYVEVDCNCVVIFSHFFCNENSSTRSPCALFISRISRALRIWVSRKMCFFIDNSSCRRTCSRRNSKYSWQTSYNYNLWVYAYYWMSPIQLLRDPFWYSYFINSDLVWSSNWSLLSSRRDPSQFDDSTNLKIELSNWLPDSLLLIEFRPISRTLSTLEMNLKSSFLFLTDQLSTLCTLSSLLQYYCFTIPEAV